MLIIIQDDGFFSRFKHSRNYRVFVNQSRIHLIPKMIRLSCFSPQTKKAKGIVIMIQ